VQAKKQRVIGVAVAEVEDVAMPGTEIHGETSAT
jgi:hypothetical protein